MHESHDNAHQCNGRAQSRYPGLSCTAVLNYYGVLGQSTRPTLQSQSFPQLSGTTYQPGSTGASNATFRPP